MSTKKCLGCFSFGLDLEFFAKMKKDLVSTHSQKPGLSITQDLNKMKKIPNTVFKILVNKKRVQNSSKIYSNLW